MAGSCGRNDAAVRSDLWGGGPMGVTTAFGASAGIRVENPADLLAIRSLVTLAFHDAARSDGNEAEIVDALRSDGVLTVSLVAEDDRKVVGHIAFSPIAANKRMPVGLDSEL